MFALTLVLTNTHNFRYLRYAKHRLRVSRMEEDGAWTPELADTKTSEDDPQEEQQLLSQILQWKPNMLWLLEQTRG
jgi:hypothetical protein